MNRNFWYFNRMSDLEEYENKVRKGNEGIGVSRVSLYKVDDSSWLYKYWNCLVFYLMNNDECSEKCLCR